MFYVSLALNLALVALTGRLWLCWRDARIDSERGAREFELMLQAREAEQRTELLHQHAMLMDAQRQLREVYVDREDPAVMTA